MTLFDVAVIIILIIEGLRGASVGIIRALFSLAGFWLGIIIGIVVVPAILTLDSSSISDSIFRLLLIIILGYIGGMIGRLIGLRLSSFTDKLHLQKINSLLGSVFSVGLSLGVIWLVASLFSGLPVLHINQPVQRSLIIRTLDRNLPPATTLFASFARFVDPLGFPDVFVNGGDSPERPVDPATSAEVEQALMSAGESTVAIEGFGCGGIKSGSGFVANNNHVITNAHVVAGLNRPIITDRTGWHRTTLVYFDADLDIAILRTSDLAGKPLNIDTTLQKRGTKGVALGYPGGGPLRAVPASVTRQLNALGRDIYDDDAVLRPIYELNARVESGNSGGPVVRPDGTVIGLIFARSQTEDSIGYALRGKPVADALAKAQHGREVFSGPCTAS